MNISLTRRRTAIICSRLKRLRDILVVTLLHFTLRAWNAQIALAYYNEDYSNIVRPPLRYRRPLPGWLPSCHIRARRYTVMSHLEVRLLKHFLVLGLTCGLMPQVNCPTKRSNTSISTGQTSYRSSSNCARMLISQSKCLSIEDGNLFARVERLSSFGTSLKRLSDGLIHSSRSGTSRCSTIRLMPHFPEQGFDYFCRYV